MDQFKEIPLLESLLNFQTDARNICHMPTECYHFTLQNGKQWQSDYTLMYFKN